MRQRFIAALSASLLVGTVGRPLSVRAQERGNPQASMAPQPSADSIPPDSVRPDSAKTFKDLRNHQIRFERYRRNHLGWTYWSSGYCDERIGRFCFTFSDDESAWKKPPEPAQVVAARDKLLDELKTGAEHFPGNWWIVGQRVHYLIEAEREGEALRAAADCRGADSWWCHALAGYALHVTGDDATSERAFDNALASMPEEARCEWTDLAELLEGILHKIYRDLSCDQRAQLQRRILWMADPFFSWPGNEMWTEHLSRQVLARMQDYSATPEGWRWANDLDRILKRYGWPSGWERIRGRRSDLGRPAVVSHYPKGARYYLPTAEYVTSPYEIEPTEWDVDPRRPQATYLAAHGIESVKPAESRLSMFRRAESTLVVAFYEWDDDSILGATEVSAALVATRDENGPLISSTATGQGPLGTIVLTAPGAPHLLSLELRALEKKRAGWARFGADLARLHRPGPVVSDVLVVNAADSLPETLDQAVAAIWGPNPFPKGGRVGLYWEIYGLDPNRSQVVSASLVVTKLNKGIFRKFIEWTPIASDRPPVSMTWRDVKPTEAGFLARSLSVDLPESISPGRYGLVLKIGFENGLESMVRTEIEVVDRE